MSGKIIGIIAGGVMGMGVLAGGFVAFINSKKMKAKRLIRKSGDALYNVGSLLQGMSAVIKNESC